ncbi:Probable O-methyltransferase 3 [Linum perenne]
MEDDQLQAQAHIFYHSFSYIVSMSMKCAVELGIPDLINRRSPEGPTSLSTLVSDLKLDPSKYDAVRRLMRLLVHVGFFGLQEEECYIATPSTKLLITPHLLLNLDPKVLATWTSFSGWFRGGGNADVVPLFEAVNGTPAWEYLAQNPELKNMFYLATDQDSRLIAGGLVSKCKEVFEGVETIVDVGGGNGIMAVAIAKAFPNIECTVLDLPHVVAAAEEGGSVNNLKYVGGNMFEKVPPADAVLLKSVLHNWNDEKCVELLKLCREAVGKKKKKGGKVIIGGGMVAADNKELTQVKLCFDVLMMSYCNGKERNENEWKKLFVMAGFSDYKIVHSLGTLTVVEVNP